MAHAEICPICNGKGVIEEEIGSTGEKTIKICHGCGGRGWIEVRDDPYYSPWYPYTIAWIVKGSQSYDSNIGK